MVIARSTIRYRLLQTRYVRRVSLGDFRDVDDSVERVGSVVTKGAPLVDG